MKRVIARFMLTLSLVISSVYAADNTMTLTNNTQYTYISAPSPGYQFPRSTPTSSVTIQMKSQPLTSMGFVYVSTENPQEETLLFTVGFDSNGNITYVNISCAMSKDVDCTSVTPKAPWVVTLKPR